MSFTTGGPLRYQHQRDALLKILETGGKCALLMEPGCLSGDTVVKVNRGGGTFDITMRDLVFKWSGGRRGGRGWDPGIPTRIQHEHDGASRLTEVTGAWASGRKMTYLVTTESGKQIRATNEHPFLTVSGWKRLDELAAGDRVHLIVGRGSNGRTKKVTYLETSGLALHPYARRPKVIGASRNVFKVANHRLVVEAEMNGLGLGEYIRRLKEGPIDGLEFLGPEIAVHHLDEDPRNNALSNLATMTHREHHFLHSATKASHVLEHIGAEAVVSIEPHGFEETFDLEVACTDHNFIAGGFVVHNTGKTYCAIDYACLLATRRSGQVKVLVAAPLAAVDSWITAMEAGASPQVDFWAEALTGDLTLPQRAEALAARGGSPFPRSLSAKPVPQRSGTLPSALHHHLSLALATRTERNGAASPYDPRLGPNGMNPERPRVILEVLNYDTFRSGEHKRGQIRSLMVESVLRFNPDLLICDESHILRNPASNLSKAMNDISDWVDRRLLLTGTPTPRGVGDILGQWRVVDPFAFAERTKDGALRRMSHDAFVRRYDGWWGKGNRAELESIMARNSIVVRKEDALDLPPTTDVRVSFDLSGPERKAYAELVHKLATMLRNGELVDAQNRLVQLLRLRQLTSGYLPDDNGIIHQVGTSKVDAVRSLVQDTLAGEKRIVVFAYFRQEIDMISKAVRDERTAVVQITGSTPKDERIRLRKWFGSDDPTRIVLVAQIRTLNLAVNELVTASHAVFASMTLQRDEYIQARDRLDRIGQAQKITYWLLLARNTVDETVLAAHEQRTSAEDALLAAIMAADEALA